MKYIDFKNINSIMSIPDGWILFSKTQGNNIKNTVLKHSGEIIPISRGSIFISYPENYLKVNRKQSYSERDSLYLQNDYKLSNKPDENTLKLSVSNTKCTLKIIIREQQPEICDLLEVNEESFGVIVHDRENKKAKCLSFPKFNKEDSRFYNAFMHTDGNTFIVYQKNIGKQLLIVDNPLC